MLATFRRLALGLFLIAAASAVLLISDWSHRRTDHSELRIALVQHASQGIIDDGVRGMIDGLAGKGFVEGKNISIRRFNAEADIPTANAIANEVANGGYDLLLTATTLSLQTVATANRDRRTKHVFALVSDPPSAGVGISREDPLQHPAHLAGFGTMQPIAETLKIAKELLPSLTTIGVVWNPAEANSEANVKRARSLCPDLGLTLLEANAENTAAVGEAASSLTSRGVQAIWVGGDVTAMTAIDTLVGAARRAKIPVFTSMPGSTVHGAIFDLGANYFEVGRLAGELAAEVLNGTSPATIAIRNVMPETLLINRDALAGLKEPWQFPDALVARATPVTTTDPKKHDDAK